MYHSVLLVRRIDRQELRRRKRIGNRREVDGLRGRLKRRTDWLRRRKDGQRDRV